MAKANAKANKKEMSDEEIEKLLQNGWTALNQAFDELIKGCKSQNMDLVVDALELTKKIAGVYERAYMANFYTSRGLKKNDK